MAKTSVEGRFGGEEALKSQRAMLKATAEAGIQRFFFFHSYVVSIRSAGVKREMQKHLIKLVFLGITVQRTAAFLL